MIDIHSHILPGLDDGPQSLETSVAMAKTADDDGIRTIIATPHTDGIRVSSETVLTAVEDLNRELARRNISVAIFPGHELPCHLAAGLAATHTLAGSRYVLLEYPPAYIPNDALTILNGLLDQGLVPVIAHPERNSMVLQQPELLAVHREAGALVQVTAGSLTGEHGPDIQQCALYLLFKRMVDFIGTDSHGPDFRAPILHRARNMATRLMGRDQAARLVQANPEKILRNLEFRPIS